MAANFVLLTCQVMQAGLRQTVDSEVLTPGGGEAGDGGGGALPGHGGARQPQSGKLGLQQRAAQVNHSSVLSSY